MLRAVTSPGSVSSAFARGSFPLHTWQKGLGSCGQWEPPPAVQKPRHGSTEGEESLVSAGMSFPRRGPRSHHVATADPFPPALPPSKEACPGGDCPRNLRGNPSEPPQTHHSSWCDSSRCVLEVICRGPPSRDALTLSVRVSLALEGRGFHLLLRGHQPCRQGFGTQRCAQQRGKNCC